MDFYQIIANNFQASIEAITHSVDTLAAPMEQSTSLMTEALLSDHKIVVCGNGPDNALASLFVCALLDHLEHERPALPALSLGSDASTISAVATSSSLNDIFSRQVRAIGQEGDILLCICSGQGHNNLIKAVQAAHERNMRVVALSNEKCSELGTLIRTEDVLLRVSALSRPRVLELHTMVIHNLCELIDRSLFGSYARD